MKFIFLHLSCYDNIVDSLSKFYFMKRLLFIAVIVFVGSSLQARPDHSEQKFAVSQFEKFTPLVPQMQVCEVAVMNENVATEIPALVLISTSPKRENQKFSFSPAVRVESASSNAPPLRRS